MNFLVLQVVNSFLFKHFFLSLGWGKEHFESGALSAVLKKTIGMATYPVLNPKMEGIVSQDFRQQVFN